MIRNATLLLLWGGIFLSSCQSELPLPGAPITAREYVAASARYHDPQSRWPAFAAEIAVETFVPQSAISWVNDIYLDRARDTFSREIVRGGHLLTQTISSTGQCVATWPNPDASQEELLQNGLLDDPCRYIEFRRRFYDFLIGLPMVALEGEASFSESVTEIVVYGEPCYEVKIDFSTAATEPTWHLYLSTENYRLVAAQFEYQGSGGEWIHYPTLTEFDGFLLKKAQVWYDEDGSTEIGTDTFTYTKLIR